MNYNDAIEKLSIYFSSTAYKAEALDAKGIFFGDLGINDGESENYEQWMNLFFDWYLFSRPLSGTHWSPCRKFLETDEFSKMEDNEKEFFLKLARCEHSLLRFIKIKNGFAFFKDLFRNRRVKVVGEFAWSPERGLICDARLIPHGDHFVFSKGFCVHPLETVPFILKEIRHLKKASPKEQQTFQMELIRMRLKMSQYSHLKFDQVYVRQKEG